MPDYELFDSFLGKEVRYTSLGKAVPAMSKELLEINKQLAKERRQSYVRLQKGFEDELQQG